MLTPHLLAILSTLVLAASLLAWCTYAAGTYALGYTLRFLTLPRTIQRAELRLSDTPITYRKAVLYALAYQEILFNLGAIFAIFHAIASL